MISDLIANISKTQPDIVKQKTPLHTAITHTNDYVAAKATYIRLLHGKIGILEWFFGPSSVHRGRTHIVLG